MPGEAVQDYVKAIYKLSQGNDRVTPTQVAEFLKVTAPAVTKMIRRLEAGRLIRYSRDDGLRLTSSGQKVALEVIRHHRLLELYLTEALGYSWDEVHEEAERLEHVISETFEDKIEQLLGYPTRDPHGSPIPTRDGTIADLTTLSLSSLRPGQNAVVDRVSDRDAGMLSYMGELGLYPGTAVSMIDQEPYGGSFRISIANERRTVGVDIANNVFVRLLEGSESQ